jgi:hypothetical protein
LARACKQLAKLPALDARAAGFFQVLDELSVVFAIEIVASEPAILIRDWTLKPRTEE